MTGKPISRKEWTVFSCSYVTSLFPEDSPGQVRYWLDTQLFTADGPDEAFAFAQQLVERDTDRYIDEEGKMIVCKAIGLHDVQYLQMSPDMILADVLGDCGMDIGRATLLPSTSPLGFVRPKEQMSIFNDVDWTWEHPMTLPALEATLLPLTRQAGAAIMAVYATDFDTRAKDDASPVTEADLAADRIIVAGLSAAFPDIAIVTEERAATHEGERPERFFLVDPLDGTKEFVKRGGDFTVNIALIDKGVPVRGVVYAPVADRMFWTADDGTAKVQDAMEPVRPLRCAAPDNAALRVVATKSHKNPETEEYIARYQVSDYKSAGSSLKFCLLAAGEADLYPRLGPTMEWDTGAGDAVLRAAGGHCERMEGGPLLYGKSDLYNPHFVAYAEGVELK